MHAATQVSQEAAMTLPAIFLDDGGVLNDNQVRGAQWQRLVGEYFPPRLGGAPEAWAEANRVVINRILEREAWQVRLRANSDYAAFDRAYQLDWLRWMCAHVASRPRPMMSLALARNARPIRRVRSAYPGAIKGSGHCMKGTPCTRPPARRRASSGLPGRHGRARLL
jgi:hypothetical protein